MRPRVFVTQPIAASAIERLRAVADVEVNPDGSRVPSKDVLLAGVRRCDILFSLLHDKIDRDVIAANPKLKAVASMSITPDNIDIAEATARRIPVTVIPAVVTEATADLTIGLMIAVARRILEGDRLVHSGVFPGSQSNYLAGSWVTGKVLGLIGGGGRIGRAVAKRAQGFSMRLLYWSPRRKPDVEKELGLEHRSLDQLMAESDFISVHAPLNPDTRHMIGDRQFGLMKPTAFLINAARGPIVEEAALVRALAARRIAGAGLDVHEHEPQVAPELLKMSNIVVTPHLGSAVAELREKMAHVVVDNVLALLEGRQPPNCYNPEVFKS
ncbi:MAG: D-glycerate dehydrogenase [Xanthobacteraceae bacterium]|nr:D-glycerate dehydrogenase [Xanthobacteraceae bacterium]